MDYWYKYIHVEKFLLEKGFSYYEIAKKLGRDPRIAIANGFLIISKDIINDVIGEQFMETISPEHPDMGFPHAVVIL